MRLSIRDWRLPLLAGAAFLFARLGTGRFLYFLFYASAGMLLVSFIWTWSILRFLGLRLHPMRQRLQVGEPFGVRLEVQNRSLLPVPWLEVDDDSPSSRVDNPARQQGTALPPRGCRVIEWQGQVRCRGHYRIGPVRVAAGDPFGLFRGERQIHSRVWVTVYPRVPSVELQFPALSHSTGSLRTRKQAFADAGGLMNVRPYRPGDNPRHIHWKSSAHIGTLMLREVDPDAGMRLLLVPDMAEASYPAGGPKASVEAVVEATAGIAALCLRRQFECRLVAHAQKRFETGPERGERAFREILEVLARVEARGPLPLEKVLEQEVARLTGRCAVVAVTPHLAPRLAEVLIILQRRHPVTLVLVGEPAGARAEEERVLAGQLADAGVHLRRLPVQDAMNRLAGGAPPGAPEVRSP